MELGSRIFIFGFFNSLAHTMPLFFFLKIYNEKEMINLAKKKEMIKEQQRK